MEDCIQWELLGSPKRHCTLHVNCTCAHTHTHTRHTHTHTHTHTHQTHTRHTEQLAQYYDVCSCVTSQHTTPPCTAGLCITVSGGSSFHYTIQLVGETEKNTRCTLHVFSHSRFHQKSVHNVLHSLKHNIICT